MILTTLSFRSYLQQDIINKIKKLDTVQEKIFAIQIITRVNKGQL